jgi:hypothetical protein
MALLGKARTAAGAGVLVTLVLVLVFGNQAVTDWVANHTNPDTVHGWYLRILTWPSWAFGPRDDSAAAMRDLLAADLRAILLILFVAMVLGLAAKTATGATAFVVGWAALILGSALAAFLTAFIASHASWLGAFGSAAAGSSYGLFAGWIVGAAVASAKGGA